MKNLYVLQEIKQKDIEIIKQKDSKLITFDYTSHRLLVHNNLEHGLLDDYLDNDERKQVFQKCSEYLLKLEEFENDNLTFHKINLINIIDRNELLEFLMEIIPRVIALKNILKNSEYGKIFLPSDLYEIFHKHDLDDKIYLFNKIKIDDLTFEKIKIPFKVGKIESSITLNREKYQFVKNTTEKILGKSLNLSKNNSTLQKIILVEFDPETYSELLDEIKAHNLQAVLVNFRKSATYSKKALDNLRRTNSIVISAEQFLTSMDHNIIKEEKDDFLKYIRQNFEECNLIPDLEFFNISITKVIIKKIIKILIQRIEEYLNCILIAKKIISEYDSLGVMMLNRSGETEKIFGSVFDDASVFLLQHAFANYNKNTSYFDLLDDYHIAKNKFIVWGNLVRDYLIDTRKISESNIIVAGSPKYDCYSSSVVRKKRKRTILVTLRPIINHMEGLRISLFDRYEEIIQKLIQISGFEEDLEIIFKLHPQQNVSNDVIINLIKRNKKNIFQFEPIRDLLINCDIHVNIATDNFDASSVILEGMLLKKPILNISLQKESNEFEFISNNSIRNIYYDSDIKENINEILDEQEIKHLQENSSVFLKEYLANRGTASKNLIESIININKKN